MAYTEKALAGSKEPEFEPPPGITFARVHHETGQLMPPGAPGGISEPFKVGTTPDGTSGPGGTKGVGADFMKVDSEGL